VHYISFSKTRITFRRSRRNSALYLYWKWPYLNTVRYFFSFITYLFLQGWAAFNVATVVRIRRRDLSGFGGWGGGGDNTPPIPWSLFDVVGGNNPADGAAVASVRICTVHTSHRCRDLSYITVAYTSLRAQSFSLRCCWRVPPSSGRGIVILF
jgi:hypothetical protein